MFASAACEESRFILVMTSLDHVIGIRLPLPGCPHEQNPDSQPAPRLEHSDRPLESTALELRRSRGNGS